MNQNTPVSVLRSALNSIETIQSEGRVTAAAVNAIVAAVTLGAEILPPPRALPGKPPMAQKSVDAPAGSWPHFFRVLERMVESDFVGSTVVQKIERLRKDAATDRKMGEAERAERLAKEADGLYKEKEFFKWCLSVMRHAIYAAITSLADADRKAELAAKEADRKAEAKRKVDEEAKMSAEQKAAVEAKRAEKAAALAALKSAAVINTAAPVALSPKGKVGEPAKEERKLTPDGLCELVAKAIEQNQKGGRGRGPMELEAATSRAISWAVCVVLPSRSGLNPNELVALEDAILDAGFKSLFVPESNNSKDAQQMARRFVDNAKALREQTAKAKSTEAKDVRKDAPKPDVVPQLVAKPAPKEPKGPKPKGTLAEQLQARNVVATAPGGDA